MLTRVFSLLCLDIDLIVVTIARDRVANYVILASSLSSVFVDYTRKLKLREGSRCVLLSFFIIGIN